MLDKLAEIVASIKNWGDLKKKPLTHKIETEKSGWVRLRNNEVDVVSEIKKVEGLKYKQFTEGDYDTHYFVAVTDEVGQLIELYIKSGEYAGLPLSEFITEAIKP